MLAHFFRTVRKCGAAKCGCGCTLKNLLLKKLFCFSSDFDETWWSCSTHVYYNLTKFYQNRMKNKKVFLIAHFLPISALYGPTAAQWGRTPAQCGKLSLWTYVYDYKPILHWKCCSYNFIIQVAPSLSKTAILLVVLLFVEKICISYE